MDDLCEFNDIEESDGLLWNCCVCNVLFVSKRVLLYYIRIIYRLKGEDVEIVAKRKFIFDVDDLFSIKKMRIDEEKDIVGNMRKDDQMYWKCLDCGNIYVYKNSVKIYLKKDYNVSLVEFLGYFIEVIREELGYVVNIEENGGFYKCKKCWKDYLLKLFVVRYLKVDYYVVRLNVYNFIDYLFF